MKRIFSLIICSLISGVGMAQQTFQWAEMYSAPSTEDVWDVTTDPSGNLYVASMFTGTLDIDPGPGTFTVNTNGIEDIGISKIDPNGNLIWAKTFGGTSMDWVNGITLDASGNVFVIGTFANIVDFDPGPGTFTLSATGARVFVLKLDPSGNFLWVKNYGGAFALDVYDLKSDAIGDVYVTGYFNGSVDFDPGPASFSLTAVAQDAYILKLSAAGNFLWVKKLGDTANDNSYGVETDASANVYITGIFQNTVDFDPGPGTFTLSAIGEDIFLCKFDAAGNFLMAQKMGGAGQDRGQAIHIDVSGNIIIGGIFSGTADLDPGVGIYNLISGGGFDLFLVKLNASGNFVWAKGTGGTSTDGVSEISTDAAGNIYMAGYFNALVDFDMGPGTYNVNSMGTFDGYIMKVDPSGNFNWMVPLGSINFDAATCITADGFGNVYSGGYFQGFLDFDPGSIVYGFNVLGGQDAYIHKMGYCTTAPLMPSSISGPSLFCSGTTTMNLNYSVTPVPGANYSWTVPATWTGGSTTNSLSVINGTSGVISVAATNSCGTSATQTLNVIIDTPPAISVASSSSLICVGQTVTLTASGASSYTWNPGLVTGNPVAVSPTITTTYTITGVSIYGCSNTSTQMQNVSPCTNIQSLTDEKNTRLFPNPNNGEFYLETLNDVDILITDFLGRQISHYKLTRGLKKISTSEEMPGIYFVKIIDGSEERVVKFIKN